MIALSQFIKIFLENDYATTKAHSKSHCPNSFLNGQFLKHDAYILSRNNDGLGYWYEQNLRIWFMSFFFILKYFCTLKSRNLGVLHWDITSTWDCPLLIGIGRAIVIEGAGIQFWKPYLNLVMTIQCWVSPLRWIPTISF